jgi:hypothetical protein
LGVDRVLPLSRIHTFSPPLMMTSPLQTLYRLSSENPVAEVITAGQDAPHVAT